MICYSMIYNNIMSITVNGHALVPNEASFDPIDYFNAWRTESQIPTLVIQKIETIIDQYYQMKPQKIKRQNQMKTLFKYNKKLVQTIESFIVHEKKIVDRYNALCQLYISSFQKYCSTKSWDVNFNIKPIRSHFEKFSLSDWEFKIEEEKQLQNDYQYSSLLLNSVKNYFLNGQNHLQKLLKKISAKHNLQNNKETVLQLQQIKKEIKELNNTTITKDNMFDLLQKRKNIEFEIRQFDQDFDYGFFRNDNNFIQEIKEIHSKLFQIQPSKIKEYLKHENLIRRKFKKKSKQYRKDLQQRLEKIECQNGELKTEYEIQKRKREEAQKQKDKIKTQYEYLQLKANQSTRRDKTQINNTINNFGGQDSKNNDNIKSTQYCSIIIREPPSKKQDLRINQLQNQISKLRTELNEKQIELKKSISKNDVRKDEMIEDLRRKIISKLDQFGIKYEKEMPVNVLLQKLLDKVGLHGNSLSRQEKRSDIMLQSVAIDGWQPLKTLPIKKQNERQSQEMYPSNYKKDALQFEKQEKIILISPRLKNNKQVLKGSYDMRSSRDLKSSDRSIRSKDMRSSREFPPSPTSFIELYSNLAERSEREDEDVRPTWRINTLGAIQKKKSMQQESKNIIDHSKHVLSEEKISFKNSLLTEQQREMTKVINSLKQQNQRLREQIDSLQQQIAALEQKLNEKEKGCPPKSFIQSYDLDFKFKDNHHLQQIQNVCQSIAKELVKLDGSQFEKMVSLVQTAIKTCSDQSKKHNINQIPILSKNLKDENLFRSENIVMQPFKNQMEQPFKNRLRASLATERQRSMKLALQSGEVKLHLNMQKSIYFGNKDNQVYETNQIKISPPKITNNCETQSKIEDEDIQSEEIRLQKQEDFIEIVTNFEAMSRKKDKPRDLSENSLKCISFKDLDSIDQRDDDLRSSLKLISPKLIQDTEFILKLQRKIQEIKNNSENGNDLYWFYKKYKQAIEALQKSQATLRMLQFRKESCLKKLNIDQGLSKYKLEQNIYFLQVRVKELESVLQNCKEDYEYSMTKDITEIDKLKEVVLAAIQKKILKDQKWK